MRPGWNLYTENLQNLYALRNTKAVFREDLFRIVEIPHIKRKSKIVESAVLLKHIAIEETTPVETTPKTVDRKTCTSTYELLEHGQETDTLSINDTVNFLALEIGIMSLINKVEWSIN